MKASHRILVVDDETGLSEFVCAAAQAMGFQCTATSDAKALLAALAPDTTLIMIDLMMPEMDGVELLRLLAERKCKAGIVLMSSVGKRTMETAGQLAQVLGLTIVGLLQKPFRLTELEEVLRKPIVAKALPVVSQPLPVVIQKEELRSAIEHDEFVLHYQPQIDILTGGVVGVEALVRWRHPEQGLIFPESFIGRAEEFGLIDQLGWLVVNRGMSEVGQFANDKGIAPMLSLNASVHSLTDLKFPDILLSVAKKYGVFPGDVTIEVTETGLIKDLLNTLDILTRLRMKQV